MISLLFGIKDQISKKSLGYINKLYQRIVLQRTGRFACTHSPLTKLADEQLRVMFPVIQHLNNPLKNIKTSIVLTFRSITHIHGFINLLKVLGKSIVNDLFVACYFWLQINAPLLLLFYFIFSFPLFRCLCQFSNLYNERMINVQYCTQVLSCPSFHYILIPKIYMWS